MEISKSMINVSLLWAAITATVSVMLWLFTNIAWASDIEELQDKLIAQEIRQELQAAYGQYYDRLDDYEEALAEGRQALAAEYLRQMERSKAIICKYEPSWERC